MKRLVVTIAAVVCLGAHALMGCCWGHVGDGDCCQVAAAGDSHADHCHKSCCHHHKSQQAPSHTPHPCKCDCRATCNFLPTVKVECEKSNAGGYVVFLPPIEAGFQLGSAIASHELAMPAASTALPLRVHLLHQVLQV